MPVGNKGPHEGVEKSRTGVRLASLFFEYSRQRAVSDAPEYQRDQEDVSQQEEYRPAPSENVPDAYEVDAAIKRIVEPFAPPFERLTDMSRGYVFFPIRKIDTNAVRQKKEFPVLDKPSRSSFRGDDESRSLGNDRHHVVVCRDNGEVKYDTPRVQHYAECDNKDEYDIHEPPRFVVCVKEQFFSDVQLLFLNSLSKTILPHRCILSTSSLYISHPTCYR